MSPRSAGPPCPAEPGDHAAGPALGERGTEGGSRQLAAASDCPLGVT